MAYQTRSDASLASRLAALADPTRRAVLEQLRGGPLTVGEIAERLPVSRPAVSQHLRALSDAELVSDSWEGTRHYFRLDSASLLELRGYFEEMWQAAMNEFARHVAAEEARHAGKSRTRRRR
jgi:DNA-binding transcriptional ArsR family regulator